MILDQPGETPRKKKITWFELVMMLVIFASMTAYETMLIPYSYAVWHFAMFALGLGYLFGYYWIDTPDKKDQGFPWFSICYGIAFFSAILAFNGFFDDRFRATAIVFVLLITILAIDYVSSANKTPVATTQTFIRMIALVGLLVLRNVLHIL
jgi:hypothetical protein